MGHSLRERMGYGVPYKKAIDSEVIQHCFNVGEYTKSFAKYIGFSNCEVELFKLAAIQHDLGKMDCDPKILLKPGLLNKKERKHVNEHVIHSFNRAVDLEQPCFSVLESIFFHHENYDGTGYPYKLKGSEIPIGARIIRICDYYDALTTDRSYKKAMTTSEALKIMKDNENCFDPELIKIFYNYISLYNLENESA